MGMSLLLGLPNSTKYSILKFPIICKKIERGENVFYLDLTKLARYFDAKNVDAENMSTARCDKWTRRDAGKPPAMKTDPSQQALDQTPEGFINQIERQRTASA